jgi:hypothetical protein
MPIFYKGAVLNTNDYSPATINAWAAGAPSVPAPVA